MVVMILTADEALGLGVEERWFQKQTPQGKSPNFHPLP